MRQPVVSGDRVVLRSGSNSRLVVFSRGSDIMSIDGRVVVLEGVPVAGDGTVLTATSQSGRTEVVRERVNGELLRVLYVGAGVVDQAGWTGTIFRTQPVPVQVQWA